MPDFGLREEAPRAVDHAEAARRMGTRPTVSAMISAVSLGERRFDALLCQRQVARRFVDEHRRKLADQLA